MLSLKTFTVPHAEYENNVTHSQKIIISVSLASHEFCVVYMICEPASLDDRIGTPPEFLSPDRRAAQLKGYDDGNGR
jgi:hypothetical protein